MASRSEFYAQTDDLALARNAEEDIVSATDPSGRSVETVQAAGRLSAELADVEVSLPTRVRRPRPQSSLRPSQIPFNGKYTAMEFSMPPLAEGEDALVVQLKQAIASGRYVPGK